MTITFEDLLFLYQQDKLDIPRLPFSPVNYETVIDEGIVLCNKEKNRFVKEYMTNLLLDLTEYSNTLNNKLNKTLELTY